jgi:O-antigen/teichoic acid export membrane protein
VPLRNTAGRAPGSDARPLDREDSESGWAGAWFRDTGLMLLSQGALTATATLVTILLARSLSKYEFGIFSSFLGAAQAFSFLIDAGLSTWLLRECSRIRVSPVPQSQQDSTISGLLWDAVSAVAYLGTTIALGSVAFGLVVGLGLNLALAQGAFMVYIALLAAATALEARLRAERRLRQVLSAVLCEKASLVLLVGTVLALHAGLLAVGLAFVVAGTARLSLDFYRSRGLLRSYRAFVTLDRVRRPSTVFPLLKLTGPFGLNEAAVSFLPRMDTALVATISVVGASYYGLGFQIVTTAAVIPAIASITLLPLLVKQPGARLSRWPIFGFMTGAGVIAAGCGVALAPWVIPLLFGTAYRPAIGAIQIMLLSIPCIFACNALVPFLYNDGYERDVLRWVLVPSAVGTGFVILGEAVVGPSGASCGLVARYILVMFSFMLLSGRRTRAS